MTVTEPRNEPRYRYRVMGNKGEGRITVELESWATDRDDALEKAALYRRWGWTAWPERKLIVDPPKWERVP